ncbi:MAG: tetratricopeptide repeat-containing sensor histidine kinase [Arcticibacter sp.]
MPRITLLAQLLLFFCYSAYSLERPSLQEVSNLSVPAVRPDTAQVNRLNDLANEYLKEQVFDSVELFSKRAVTLSESINFKYGLSVALANIAKVHYMKGDYKPALSSILKSLNLSESIHHPAGVAICLNVIGLIHLAQGNRELSLEEFSKAATLNMKVGDRYRLSTNYFNMGLAYNELNLTDSALTAFSKAIKISTEIRHLNMQAMASNRLGDTHFKRNEIDAAIRYYSSVLNNDEYQNDWENSFAYTGLAQCFEKQGRYRNAVKYAGRGLELAEKKKVKWDAERAFRVLHHSYAKLGDYRLAYKYLLLNKSFSDSLLNESKVKELNALQLNHQKAVNRVLIKEKEMALQKSLLSKQVLFLSVFIIALLIFLLFVLFRNVRVKNRLNKDLTKKSVHLEERKEEIKQQNSELNELNRTKDQLFSIISHDLRSPFAAILGTLQLLKTVEVDRDELTYLLDTLYEQTAATSAMTDNLLVWARSQQEGISARFSRVQLSEVMMEVLTVFQNIATEKRIEIRHEIDKDAYSYADRDHVKIILQNLLANAIKFTPAKGRIAILYGAHQGTTCVSIQDNGVGMSENKIQQLFHRSGKDISTAGTNNETGIGIGLVLVKKFVDANQGTLVVNSAENEGTTFRVCFRRDV